MPNYYIGGDVTWQRAESVPNENLECYDHKTCINLEGELSCVDDQFGDGTTICPTALLINAVAMSHMFLFIELCGKNNFSVQSYRDSPFAYMSENDESELESIFLSPGVFFEGESVPTWEEIQDLHNTVSKTGTLEKLLDGKVQLRLN